MLYAALSILIVLMFEVGAGVYSSDVYDMLVNDDRSGADQYDPKIAVGKDGDFVVIWSDKRNGQNDIYFQLFDSTGTPQGYNQKVNNDALNVPQLEPSVDASRSGQFVAIWQDYRNGTYPFYPDIYFSQIDTLQPSDNINVTVQIVDLTCESPDIAMFPDGASVVVWSDYRNNNWDIYGQRIGVDGSLVGVNFKINTDVGVNQQHSPRVAAFQDGGFVVVWYDDRSGNDDIFTQRFDSAANPVGEGIGNIRVSDDITNARQAFPSVSADGNGRFFVAWIDWRNGTYPHNPDIYLRRFDSSDQPFGPSKKINSSDGGRAQRDVSLCADRMGNICVVWADSSSGQWDVMAQIVDYNGKIDGTSFIVHENAEGKQLQPDVATDGYKHYFVWADYRNRNYDIYTSIRQYNDPTLIPDPNIVEFTMEEGESLPSSQTIALSNAGYGELSWSVTPEIDWISVNPSSGMTPDTFQVQVIADSLPYGTYYGDVRLIDLDHGDSSEVVSIRLTVTAPILDISPDTLYFKVLAELGNPDPKKFLINNSGSGNLNWTALENAFWFETDKQSGAQSEYVTVHVDISGLEYGDYFEPFVVNSDEAVNSPETAWVHLELAGNMPYLDVSSDSLTFQGVVGDRFYANIDVFNLGAGSLDWTAVSGADWIILDKETGSDYETIGITVETSILSAGCHGSDIIIYDSASFNQEVVIPVVIVLYPISEDTVQFINANAMPGGMGVMPLNLNLHSPAKGGYIPFGYDKNTAVLDSIIVDTQSMPSFVEFFAGIAPPGKGEIGFKVNEDVIGDSLMPEGDYHIADLFFTVSDTNVFNYVDTSSSDSSCLYILDQLLTRRVPVILSGRLIIGNPTSVNDRDHPLLPPSAVLAQNYPNPFNLATTIEICLQRTSNVSINIYNMLGQRVYSLHDGDLPEGRHKFVWNGMFQNSCPAPSGIYFCHLVDGNYAEVKKMVLLK